MLSKTSDNPVNDLTVVCVDDSLLSVQELFRDEQMMLLCNLYQSIFDGVEWTVVIRVSGR